MQPDPRQAGCSPSPRVRLIATGIMICWKLNATTVANGHHFFLASSSFINNAPEFLRLVCAYAATGVGGKVQGVFMLRFATVKEFGSAAALDRAGTYITSTGT